MTMTMMMTNEHRLYESFNHMIPSSVLWSSLHSVRNDRVNNERGVPSSDIMILGQLTPVFGKEPLHMLCVQFSSFDPSLDAACQCQGGHLSVFLPSNVIREPT